MINRIFVFIMVIGGVLGYWAFASYFPEGQRAFGFQEAQSPVMERIEALNDILLVMCFAISGIVIALLFFVSYRFSKKNNPKPATFSHNTTVEIIWTGIPILILVALAFPSMKLLYYMDKVADADMTLKVVGYQWYWGYEYPEEGIEFESLMIPDDEIKEGQQRLLETDTQVVLPIDTDIRILMTSADVLHAWAIPQLGIKKDTVPGRLNESWVRINKTGIYRGQCSELCGVNHGFMPIVVKAVTKEEYARWVKMKKLEG